jgi:hypothetical protein
VIAAVGLARDAGLPVAVRGGGHSYPGHSVRDDGIVIDLGPMKGIRVDPQTRTARVQAGALWGELDRETACHSTAALGELIDLIEHAGRSGNPRRVGAPRRRPRPALGDRAFEEPCRRLPGAAKSGGEDDRDERLLGVRDSLPDRAPIRGRYLVRGRGDEPERGVGLGRSSDEAPREPAGQRRRAVQ